MGDSNVFAQREVPNQHWSTVPDVLSQQRQQTKLKQGSIAIQTKGNQPLGSVTWNDHATRRATESVAVRKKCSECSKKKKVQRKEAGVAQPAQESAEAIAQSGLRGAGGKLPHLKKIEQAFGRPMGHVQAYVAPQACEKLGALGYEYKGKVAFKTANPSAELAGHEAMHTLQKSPPGLSNESQADEAGKKVANGQNATGLLSSSPIAFKTVNSCVGLAGQEAIHTTLLQKKSSSKGSQADEAAKEALIRNKGRGNSSGLDAINSPDRICDKKTYQDLREKLKVANRVVTNLGGCKEDDTPELRATKIAAWSALYAARMEMSNKCFGGPDDMHKRVAEEVKGVIGNCESLPTAQGETNQALDAAVNTVLNLVLGAAAPFLIIAAVLTLLALLVVFAAGSAFKWAIDDLRGAF